MLHEGYPLGNFLSSVFSDHAAELKVSSCGHSLYRDCLRFYGWGWRLACFRYAMINIHSICLPFPKLEFNCDKLEWIQKEATKVTDNTGFLFSEAQNALRHQLSEKLGNVGSTCIIGYALASIYPRLQHGDANPMNGSDSSKFLSHIDSANSFVSTNDQHTTMSFSDDVVLLEK